MSYRSLPALKVGFIPSVDLLTLGVAWAPLLIDFQSAILYLPICVLCDRIFRIFGL
ncbi:hypothetical protein [Gardnerella vaginalis]|uniref:hypothetical protein n=1 Tax=Gardnerella vaginalis TaxID=2702 RepID=UPI0039EE52D0